MDFYQVWSNYSPRAKYGPAPAGHVFNIGLYRDSMKNSCMKDKGIEP